MQGSRSKSCKKCEHWFHNGVDLVCSSCGKPKSLANSDIELDISESEESDFQARYERENADKRYELWKVSEGISTQSQVTNTERSTIKTSDSMGNEEQIAQKKQYVFSSDKASRAKVARQSANLVNTFGAALQVFAIVVCMSILILSTWLSAQVNGNYVPGLLVGIVISSILLFIYASIGALYRMIANYILFKTSDDD